jgi:hypothetical protein
VTLVPLLAACPAELVGTVGLTVDEHGDPVVALSWCKGPPTRIAVEQEVESTADDRDVEWEQIAWYETDDPPSGRLILVSLMDPGPVWAADPTFKELEADTQYAVLVWPNNGAQIIGSFQFDAEQLAAMEPGVIEAHDFRGDAEAFESMAQERC